MIDFDIFTKKCLRMWEDLGKLIVAKGFKKLPKEQKIAHSGHTGLIPVENYNALPTWFKLR